MSRVRIIEDTIQNNSTLNELEFHVIVERFGLNDGQSKTLEQVGREFNCTRERIRQIEAKALYKLFGRGKILNLGDGVEQYRMLIELALDGINVEHIKSCDCRKCTG